MKEVLRFENVSMHYHSKQGETVALQDVSFSVNEGEFVAIIGPSGCGKTTLLSLAAGLLSPTKGKVYTNGGSFGYMLQKDELFPWRTIEKNIFLPLEIKRADTPEHRARALALAEKYGLSQFLKNYPSSLSGGMRQRVMIAMSLACRPKLLIADEPTTALDVTIQAQILRLMRELQRKNGAAILFITHDLGVVNEMADDVAVMYCGQIAEYAKREDIFGENGYSHPYTEGLLASIPTQSAKGKKLECIFGNVPTPLELPKGCKFSTRCKYCTEKCIAEEPPLFETKAGRKIRCFYPEKEERKSASHQKLVVRRST